MARRKAEAQAPAQEPAARIYIGPSFPAGFMRTGQVYSGGLPGPVTQMLAKEPLLARLIVGTDEYRTAVVEAQKTATPRNAAYRTVLSKIKNGELR